MDEGIAYRARVYDTVRVQLYSTCTTAVYTVVLLLLIVVYSNTKRVPGLVMLHRTSTVDARGTRVRLESGFVFASLAARIAGDRATGR